MNLSLRRFALLFALILIHGCTGKDDASMSQQNAEGNAITQEEDLIVTTLNNIANAESQFSKTIDSPSILRFYTQDYAGVKDGKSQTVKDQEIYLAEVLARINSDEPIGILSRVMNIKATVAGTFGWATYEYEYKVVRSGMLQRYSNGRCTAIFRKQVEAWLIRHEHCSTANPAPFFLTPK
ncbi:MAG: nuclear transport factor 2 family protein [Nitrospirae bacterium]|nr:nuclear transport factor 2 family protein [Nitrospirota bacterium]